MQVTLNLADLLARPGLLKPDVSVSYFYFACDPKLTGRFFRLFVSLPRPGSRSMRSLLLSTRRSKTRRTLLLRLLKTADWPRRRLSEPP